MTVRVRAGTTQAETEDRAWPARRDYLLRYFPDHELLEARGHWLESRP